MRLTKQFIVLTIVQCVMSLFPIIPAVFFPCTVIFAIFVAIVTIGTSVMNYIYLRKHLKYLMQHEVDRLLQSDEYRYAAINNEEIFNKAADTLDHTGQLKELQRYHWLCFGFVAAMVVLTLCVQMQLALGG